MFKTVRINPLNDSISTNPRNGVDRAVYSQISDTLKGVVESSIEQEIYIVDDIHDLIYQNSCEDIDD